MNQNILDTLLNALMPSESSKEWEAHIENGKFPAFQSKDGEIFFYSSKVCWNALKKARPTPNRYSRKPHFRKLFPNVKKATKTGIYLHL